MEICIHLPLNTHSLSPCRTRAALNSKRENEAWCDQHVLLNQLHHSTLLQTGLLGKVGHVHSPDISQRTKDSNLFL